MGNISKRAKIYNLTTITDSDISMNVWFQILLVLINIYATWFKCGKIFIYV